MWCHKYILIQDGCIGSGTGVTESLITSYSGILVVTATGSRYSFYLRLPLIPQDSIEESIRLDLVGFTRKIILEGFDFLEMVDQPLDLIHLKHCHDLSIHSHHEVASIPLYQCLDAVLLMEGDVSSSIYDSQP